MSEKLQIEVFKNFISVPGCQFTRTSLALENPSEETFRSAFGFLQTVEGCSAWWWGDLILAHTEWEGARQKDSKGRYIESYGAGKWASLLSREECTIREWVQVALFFPPHARNQELSWAIHSVAKDGGSGDLALAQDWLNKAEKAHWSKTELRAEIRLARRNSAEPAEPLPTVRMQEVVAFNRWSRAQINRVPQMDEDERAALRRELEPAERLIAALDELDKI